MKKFLLPKFSQVIEQDGRQGTFFKGPQGKFTVIGQVIRSFLEDLRGRWKQFLKKSLFSDEKQICQIFFALPRMADLKQQVIRLHKVFLAIVLQVLRSFL